MQPKLIRRKTFPTPVGVIPAEQKLILLPLYIPYTRRGDSQGF